MSVDLVDQPVNVRVIARGTGVRAANRLRRVYGGSNWRKMKGVARVRLVSGKIRKAEVHWYEVHGVGKKEFKIKRFLD